MDVEKHPRRSACTTIDCSVCGYRDCGFNDFMHYCGDSCPSCGFVETFALSESIRGNATDQVRVAQEDADPKK
jgi:predicted nucleic-acid-binding Zn-ribbon protein